MSRYSSLAAPSTLAFDDEAPARPTHRHGNATIALHWASSAAVLLSAVAVLARELTENETLRSLLLDVHRQTGLFVLLAWALRLAVRWRVGMANHAGDMPWPLRLAAHGAHLSLYAALLALPLLGIATSQAHEVTVRLFGLWRLPMLVEADPDLAERLSDWHGYVAWALLALVAAHIAAALWHHLMRRDGVLSAMLPLVQRR